MTNIPLDDEEEEVSRDRFVVLLRHGICEEATPEKPDEERALTPEGHARMKQIANGLERIFSRPQVIWSSPLLRATQTALWVAKAYRSRVRVEQTDVLRPGVGPEEFIRFLTETQTEERRAILVGHEPSLSQNLMALLHATDRRFELKRGGCYGIRLHADGRIVLEWLLSPRVLRKLAET